MAAKTPLTTKSTAGYVDPALGLYTECAGRTNSTAATTTNNIKSDVGDVMSNRNGLKLSVFFFTDIDSGDTWASGLKGVKATAWQGADATDDVGNAVLTAAATGTISFIVTNANSEGWLWVLHSN